MLRLNKILALLVKLKIQYRKDQLYFNLVHLMRVSGDRYKKISLENKYSSIL